EGREEHVSQSPRLTRSMNRPMTIARLAAPPRLPLTVNLEPYSARDSARVRFDPWPQGEAPWQLPFPIDPLPHTGYPKAGMYNCRASFGDPPDRESQFPYDHSKPYVIPLRLPAAPNLKA